MIFAEKMNCLIVLTFFFKVSIQVGEIGRTASHDASKPLCLCFDLKSDSFPCIIRYVLHVCK